MPNGIADKTYGTVAADRRKEMSGLQFVRGLVEGSLPLNTIARTLGYDVTEVVRRTRGRDSEAERRAPQPGRYRAWRLRGHAA